MTVVILDMENRELEVHKALNSCVWTHIAEYRFCKICGRIQWNSILQKRWNDENEEWAKQAVRYDLTELGYHRIAKSMELIWNLKD